MICNDCKQCNYFYVSEVGCFGRDKPCKHFSPSDYEFPLSEDGNVDWEAENDKVD